MLLLENPQEIRSRLETSLAFRFDHLRKISPLVDDFGKRSKLRIKRQRWHSGPSAERSVRIVRVFPGFYGLPIRSRLRGWLRPERPQVSGGADVERFAGDGGSAANAFAKFVDGHHVERVAGTNHGEHT